MVRGGTACAGRFRSVKPDGTVASEPKGPIPPPLPPVYKREVTEQDFEKAYFQVNRSNPELADFSDDQLRQMADQSLASRSMCFNFICNDDDFDSPDPLRAKAAQYLAGQRGQDE